MTKNSLPDENLTESHPPPLIFYNPPAPTAENQKDFSWTLLSDEDLDDEDLDDEDLTIYRKSK